LIFIKVFVLRKDEPLDSLEKMEDNIRKEQPRGDIGVDDRLIDLELILYQAPVIM
jgi:hypothetical protein